MTSNQNYTATIPVTPLTADPVSAKTSDSPPPLIFKVPLTNPSQTSPHSLSNSDDNYTPTTSKLTPPSTPPHEDSNSTVAQSPLPPISNSGRRLSIDRSSMVFIPKTPDHQNLSNGFDNNNTPLQSPTKTPRSAKRRSTDIYNLLKTPDHKLHRSDDIEDEHHNSLTKNSSLGLYNLLVSDDNKVKLIQQSPTKLSATVFNDNHITPLSPTRNSYRVKKSDTEIKELSNNLKTRLNYAFLKVQHGWTDKPLSELEKSPMKPMLSSPPRHSTKPRPLSLHSPKIPSSSTNSHSNRMRLDEFAATRTHRRSMSSSNANVALLSALSPKQPKRSAMVKHEIDPEKTAAMSLMELSSPVKSTASISFNSTSSTHNSPTRLPLLMDGMKPPHLAPIKLNANHDVAVEDDPEEANKTETETDVDEDDVAMTNDRTDDEL